MMCIHVLLFLFVFSSSTLATADARLFHESKRNGCGANCISSDERRRVCVNDACQELESMMTRVEIGVEGVTADMINTKEIVQTILKLTGVSISSVGVEYGENETVLSVIVPVEDGATGGVIEEYVDGCVCAMHGCIKKVKSGDFDMSYLRFGYGEKTLVVLPGLSVKSVLGSADAIQARYGVFSEEYTVFFFDRRVDVPANYSVFGMARDTAAAFDAVGLKDTHLVGISQGGMIAQIMAADRHDLVKKLVLGSTSAQPDSQSIMIIGEWIRLAEIKNATGLAEAFGKAVYTESFYDKYHDAIIASLVNVSDKEYENFIILASGMDGLNITGRDMDIKCPTLVLSADGDKVFSTNHGKALAQMTGGELYIYEDYGHAAYDEAPDYLDRIGTFFGSE